MPKARSLKEAPKYRARTDKRFKPNSWRKYYGSKAWHNLREAKLIEQPLCEECMMRGLTTTATQVHHRIPFGLGVDEQQRWELFLDYDNLESICAECHRRLHGETRKKKPELNKHIKIV